MDSLEQASHSFLGRPGADVDAPALSMKTSDRVPEKIERLFRQSGDPSLGFVHLQPEPCHECFHSRKRSRGITRPAADHEIVGIIHNIGVELFLMAMKLPRQQEAPEVAVGQQRRDHTALWRSPLLPPRFGRLDASARDIVDDRRCQPALLGFNTRSS